MGGSVLWSLRVRSGWIGLFGLGRVLGLDKGFGLGRGALGGAWKGCVL